MSTSLSAHNGCIALVRNSLAHPTKRLVSSSLQQQQQYQQLRLQRRDDINNTNHPTNTKPPYLHVEVDKHDFKNLALLPQRQGGHQSKILIKSKISNVPVANVSPNYQEFISISPFEPQPYNYFKEGREWIISTTTTKGDIGNSSSIKNDDWIVLDDDNMTSNNEDNNDDNDSEGWDLISYASKKDTYANILKRYDCVVPTTTMPLSSKPIPFGMMNHYVSSSSYYRHQSIHCKNRESKKKEKKRFDADDVDADANDNFNINSPEGEIFFISKDSLAMDYHRNLRMKREKKIKRVKNRQKKMWR